MTNTKDQALKVSKELDSEIDLPEELKIHWTGCPNSCGQAYMGAIGLTGTKARNADGKMIEAYDISIGGEQGPNQKIGELKHKSVPAAELKNLLKKILIENYSAIPKTKNSSENFITLKQIIGWIRQLGKSSNSP